MNLDLNPILTLVTIISGIVTAWAIIVKRKDESKHNQAAIADLITDSARDMIETLNVQAKMAADERLAAVQTANTLQVENVKLEKSNAGLVHEVEWLRTGVGVLTDQILTLGARPKWSSKDTKPLLSRDEVEEAINQILKDNGYA